MKTTASPASLARTYLTPALLLFAIPAVGLWFAGHAEGNYDGKFVEGIQARIQADAELGAEEKSQLKAFYAATPPSMVCGSTAPELEALRAGLGEVCSDYRQFGWIRLMSWAAILLGLLGTLVAGGSAFAAHASRAAQVPSLVVGWNALKVIGALETVLQGTIAGFLSFWMTAVWFEAYYVKIILGVGALAAIAAFNVIVAIFKRPASGLDVDAEEIREEDAPELWARIRELCQQLGTEPPRHVVGGIDDNFFVTEGPVRVGEKALEGRTLFVSLALLRTLQRSEADAVLAHEMAHFSGGDTAQSQRLAPMLSRFGQYRAALYEGVITRPIFHFMTAYAALFHLALAKTQRSRELQADSAAAGQTSPRDVANALVKIGGYASYRGRVEQALFEKDERLAQLAIADRVAQGFVGYATSEAALGDLHEAVTPHPFDSHPPLQERLSNVGIDYGPEACREVLLDRPQFSWVEAISTAAGIEQRLWTSYEAQFASAHELMLAHRYGPDTEEERAVVEKYFPAISVQSKNGKFSVSIDHQQVHCSKWDAAIRFDQLEKVSVEEQLFRKYLYLKPTGAGMFGGKRSFCLNDFPSADELLEVFNRYYARHQMMVAYKAEKAA